MVPDEDRAVHRRVVTHPDVVSQRVDGEVVLVQLSTNEIYSLNSTAARFWELLEAGHSVEQAIPLLLEEFEISRAELERDVDDLLRALSELELLAVAASPET